MGCFNDEVFPIQKVKTFSVFLLWSETRSLVDGPLIIVGFISEWVVSELGNSFVCIS